MKNIVISPALKQKVSGIQLSCIECDVEVQEKNEALWATIEDKIRELDNSLPVENISKIPAIADSRKAYKACGKDPARYRLSAEALLRRVIKRRELYQVNNVVDLLNLVSISTGFSIGGYDSAEIAGNATFGIGKKDEPYQGIGRGGLNIESMPVFRDDSGAFGTPTSDSVRTSVSLKTKRFLMVIIDYGKSEKLEEATEMAVLYLKDFANAKNFEINNVNL
jgi:DNA/RNA-binding domain of Phe-tRNA-synthetase-like protein